MGMAPVDWPHLLMGLCSGQPCEKAQNIQVPLASYLCSFSKESTFPSVSFPGPSQAAVEYTKKIALSGMKNGPLAGVPSVSSRSGSLGQVLLGSWPWEGRQRSDKDNVQSVRDSPAGQIPHDRTLPEALARFVMGLVRQAREDCWPSHRVISPQ